jgi:hypothetical protein
MSDTLGTLCRRVRASRTRLGRVALTWISVEPVAFSRKPGRFVGIALIDGRRRGPLFNRMPTSFPVEHGEHTVAVSFSPHRRNRTQAGTEGPSLEVALKPGEHAWLLCREQPQWRPYLALFQRDHLVLLALSILAGGCVWLVFPFLRELIAMVTRHLAVAEPWFSLAYLVVKSRLMSTVLAMQVCIIIGTYVVLARHRSRLRAFREKFGEPWLLTEERECDEHPVGLPIPRE